jgi:predicted DNA-binding antitoxin AbrB/MazE fold protein
MTRQVEAVFEHGVLRPLEPLSLPERQHVMVPISQLPGDETQPRQAEQNWLEANAHRYPGEWLALQGYDLISHGKTARSVREEARRQGIERPLMFKVPDSNEPPYAGWI